MHTEVAAVLIDIEAELRGLALWESRAPSEEELASTQPFAIDTMSLPQWLQWIFLPRMYALIETEGDLPPRCGITPMAEEYFRGKGLPIAGLLTALEEVDTLLSGEAPDYALPSRDP